MKRAAIIVAGGAARRLGGVAKPWLLVADLPIVQHVVNAVHPHVTTIVIVGEPPIDTDPIADVLWALESPAGGGPAAAIRAGMQVLSDDVTEVLLLAGDAPFVTPALADLMARPLQHDGVAAVSDDNVQYLCSRISRGALATAVAAGGASMHSVFDHLQIDTIEVRVTDADTWEDVARLRAESGAVMSENFWLDEAAAILEIEPAMDVDAVLALARDVAHNQERKQAPLTAYLLGYAAATHNYTPAQVAEFAAKLGARAIEIGGND
jgi:molybdopterin-guanine dinucleotide biosynthesis protein A